MKHWFFRWLFPASDVKVEIDSIIKETKKAILVDYCGQQIWLPKSKVRIKENVLHIPEWLHQKKFF